MYMHVCMYMYIYIYIYICVYIYIYRERERNVVNYKLVHVTLLLNWSSGALVGVDRAPINPQKLRVRKLRVETLNRRL